MRRVGGMAAALLLSVGCKQDHGLTDLAGGDGELRFNLEFTNHELVDLDLHVITPNGFEIYYADKEDGLGGMLDVDCMCGSCVDGPFENVFWAYGGAPDNGVYSVFVEYYASCDFFSETPSDYTLRVLRSGEIVQTWTGTLDPYTSPPSYEYTYAL